MRLRKFLTRARGKKTGHGFADFFLHASEKEMKEVITEAARRANEDQRLLVENLNKLQHKAT